MKAALNSDAARILGFCMRPRHKLLAGTLLIVTAFNAIEFVFPKLLQLYVDSVAGNPLRFGPVDLSGLGSRRGRLLVMPLALLAFAVVRWLITYARKVLETRLAQGALFDLRSRIFNTMQSLSFAYHDRAHTGTLISNVVEDVRHATQFFQMGLFPLVESAAYLLIAIVVLIVVCPPAGIASAAMLCISGLAVVAYFRRAWPVFARTKELFARMVAEFTENVDGYQVVHAFGIGGQRRARYHDTVGRLHRYRFRELNINTAMSQAMVWGTVFAIPAVIACTIAASRAQGTPVTGGQLFLVFYIQRSMVMRVRMLTRAFDLLMRFKITSNRLSDLFREQAYLEDAGHAVLAPDEEATLAARGVSFAYGDSREHSVRDVSMRIEPGTRIGLVGATGAGKSTLALLLCRFYDPDSGGILLNGRDIRRYRLNEVRNQFSLVFQDTFLFSASIRDNIAYGRPDAGFEDIVHAASVAHAHAFIMDMPKGYDTMVGERGFTLSGGQRQRISIARAVLRRSRFLILDACTSAVDVLTEKAIQDSLDALRETSTIIIIAHRYSSIANADTVYVLDRGRIVESGTPAELARTGAAFRRVLQPDEEST